MATRDRGANRGLLSRRVLLMALPALILYALVLLWPTLRGVGFAFTDWDGISATFQLVGLDNFIRVFTDPEALQALGVTLLIAAIVTIIQNTLGLLLALAVNSQIKSRNVLRVILFAPAVIAPVATAYIWKYILAPDGVLNTALGAVGLSQLQQSWLGSQAGGIASIVMVIVWQFTGYSMVIFLAGLQSVPQELIEASLVDGAGVVRRFWSVTRPFLGPALTVNLMLSVVGGLKLFDQVFILTGGGPGGSTNTMSTLIYKAAFTQGEFGYGVTLAVVLTVIVAALSAFQYRRVIRGGGEA